MDTTKVLTPADLAILADADDGYRLTTVTSPTDSYITAPFQYRYDYYDHSVPKTIQGFVKKVTEPSGDYQTYEYYDNARAFRVTKSVAAGPRIQQPRQFIASTATKISHA